MLHYSEPSIICWDQMCKKWTWYTGQNSKSKVGDLKNYINNFVANHFDYQFTVAQMYNGLYQVGITVRQYSEIKRRLERMLNLILPDPKPVQLLKGGSSKKRSFVNFNDFRRFKEDELRIMNRPIIRAKYEEARNHFNKVKEVFNQRREKLGMAFDIEVYEHDKQHMLEIGYIIIRFSSITQRNSRPSIEVTSKCHFIIEENLHYKNKDTVPDNREGFKFGSSKTVTLTEALEMFCAAVTECDFIVGHSVKHDEGYLQSIGLDLTKLQKEMFDTQIIRTHEESKAINDCYFTRGLCYLLKEYNVSYKEEDLHNAGCDAYYTMMIFLRQMGYSASTVNRLFTAI